MHWHLHYRWDRRSLLRAALETPISKECTAIDTAIDAALVASMNSAFSPT